MNAQEVLNSHPPFPSQDLSCTCTWKGTIAYKQPTEQNFPADDSILNKRECTKVSNPIRTEPSRDAKFDAQQGARIPQHILLGGSNIARVFRVVVPRTGEAKFPMTPVQYLLLSLLSSAGKIFHHGTYTEAAEQFKTTKFGRQVLLSFLSQSSKFQILLHFADVISKTSFAGYRVINVWTHT